MFYSYQFDDALQQDWEWTERYAVQPDILRYAKHVADRFALWPDMQFETRVAAAHWDDAAGFWSVRLEPEGGAPETVTARFCIRRPAASRPRTCRIFPAATASAARPTTPGAGRTKRSNSLACGSR